MLLRSIWKSATPFRMNYNSRYPNFDQICASVVTEVKQNKN